MRPLRNRIINLCCEFYLLNEQCEATEKSNPRLSELQMTSRDLQLHLRDLRAGEVHLFKLDDAKVGILVNQVDQLMTPLVHAAAVTATVT